MSDANENQKVYRVYSIIEKEGKKDFWHGLGTAWPNKDGKGFNISLEVMPIPVDGVCRMVIREVTPKEADEEDAPKKKTHAKK